MILNNEADAEVMEGVAVVANTPKMMQILEAVEAVYRVGKLDMMSLRRYPNLVQARDAFFWLARKFTSRTCADAGRFLGDRDHSTASLGALRVEARFQQHEDKLRQVVARLGIDPSEVRL